MADSGGAPPSLVLGRLTLARDLVELRDQLTFASHSSAMPAKRRLAERIVGLRQQAIRRKLLGHADSDPLDEVLAPAGADLFVAVEVSRAESEGPVASAKAAIQGFAIKSMLQRIRYLEAAAGMHPGESRPFPLAYGSGVKTSELVQIAESFAAASPLTEFVDKAKSALAKAQKAQTLASPYLFMAKLKPEDSERWNKIEAEAAALRSRLRLFQSALANPSLRTPELVADLTAEYQQHIDAMAALTALHQPSVSDAYAEAEREAEAGRAELVEIGREVYGRVLASSSVTPDDATRWASQTEITPAARDRLKKIGYPVDVARKDMAEFYRLVSGRIGTVKIASEGKRRAHAGSINDLGMDGVVMLGSYFDKRVLWHELAHHVEADPLAGQVASQFIRTRAISQQTKSLRAITKNPGYNASEIALEDHFFDPYIGKVYGGSITEVFSMGIESFSDPKLLAQRVAVDHGTFEFVAGFLKTEQTPMGKAIKGLADILQDNARGAMEDSADSLKSLAKQAAKRVTVDATTPNPIDRGHAFAYYIDALKATYVGSFGDDWFLYSAPVKARKGRRQSGFLIVRLQTRIGPMGEVEPRASFTHYSIFTKDISEVKAIYAYYRATGEMVGSVDQIKDEKRFAAIAAGGL